jgi:hypothetical protein
MPVITTLFLGSVSRRGGADGDTALEASPPRRGGRGGGGRDEEAPHGGGEGWRRESGGDGNEAGSTCSGVRAARWSMYGGRVGSRAPREVPVRKGLP